MKRLEWLHYDGVAGCGVGELESAWARGHATRRPSRHDLHRTDAAVNARDATIGLLDHLVPTEGPLSVAGLFAGVGGIELGLGRAGHEAALLCEIDERAQAVLRAGFDGVPICSDVATLQGLPGGVELLTAGFPCQDLSQAGRSKGIRGEKSGLVDHVFRLVRQARPDWLLIENVPFMLHLAKGEALAYIVQQLDEIGYHWAYRVVDTRAFGLPQRRRRVFLVASERHDPRPVLYSDVAEPPKTVLKSEWRSAACGFYWTEGNRGLGWAHDCVPTLKGGTSVGVASAPAIVRSNEELGSQVVTPSLGDAERLQGFEPGWTTPAESVGRRNWRWKLIGNAVTVTAAEWLGRRLRRPSPYADAHDEPFARKRGWPPAAYDVGQGLRVPAGMTEWPLPAPWTPLAEFLAFAGNPLSERATRGFRNRLAASTLRRPEGFMEVLDAHADFMAERK